MSEKRIVRLGLWIDEAFGEWLAREPGARLWVCPADSPEADLLAALAEAHVYHCGSAKDENPRHACVTDAMLARCPSLLCVSTYGAGYDTVDVAACTRAGVIVVNQAGGNARSVAEHTIALALAVSRRIVESDRRLRRERGFSREDLMGRELAGKTIGLVGIGHTGTATARLAAAFGMTVVAVDPFLSEEEIGRRGARALPLDALLATSDVVSLHCPRDRTTLNLLDAAAISRMKRGAIFVSTARGGIHDEIALAEALRFGHLAGAGLDVWHEEPPPLDHPLLALDTVVATVHTAGVTHEARRNIAVLGAEQIATVLRGGHPPRLVNPEAWPAYAKRFEAAFGFAPAPRGAAID